eukprot:6459767-Amphidinium_carterae.1
MSLQSRSSPRASIACWAPIQRANSIKCEAAVIAGMFANKGAGCSSAPSQAYRSANWLPCHSHHSSLSALLGSGLCERTATISHARLSRLSLRAQRCARGHLELSSGVVSMAFLRTSLQSDMTTGRL